MDINIGMFIYDFEIVCMLSRYFKGVCVGTTSGNPTECFLAQRMFSLGCPRKAPSYQRT